MKIRILLFTAIAGMTYLSLSSNSAGPGAISGNLTTSSCSGGSCHGANNTSTTITLTLIDPSNGPVTNGKYKPGTTYTVNIAGSNTSVVGSPTPKAGFQLEAIKSGGAQAGSFLPGGQEHVTPISSISILEHSSPISFSSGSNYQLPSFTWSPPSVGSGTVTFNVIVNATNGDGIADNADHASTKSFTFTEQTTSVAQLSSDVLINAYPNPATDHINFKFENAETGNYAITVVDYTGRKVYADNFAMNSSSQNIAVNTSNWASGLYFAQISKDGAVRMIPISKK